MFHQPAGIIRSRAPVRIDFGGGWTDVALFAEHTPGFVLNAAINIYSYVTIRRQARPVQATRRATLKKPNMTIYSADFDMFVEAESVKQLEYDGNIDLVKGALKRMDIEAGFDIITRSNAPAGSGLGTSSAMGVALLGGLARLKGDVMLRHEIAELASVIEREELHIRGGKQDYYGSVLGGFHFMEFRGEEVKFASLDLPDDVVFELQKDLVLCYTGRSRLSGDIHEHVTNAFLSGEPETVDAIESLKQVTMEMKSVLMKGDLGGFARLMSENWTQQKRLHPSVTNEQIDRLFETANQNGAVGGKACGAGGGGCVVFQAAPDSEHLVRSALQKTGATIVDFDFDFSGLRVWEA